MTGIGKVTRVYGCQYSIRNYDRAVYSAQAPHSPAHCFCCVTQKTVAKCANFGRADVTLCGIEPCVLRDADATGVARAAADHARRRQPAVPGAAAPSRALAATSSIAQPSPANATFRLAARATKPMMAGPASMPA